MGEGLKMVAKRCGGLRVTSGNNTATYDGNGRVVLPCSKGGNCEWRVDGMDDYLFCKKCFRPYPGKA